MRVQFSDRHFPEAPSDEGSFYAVVWLPIGDPKAKWRARVSPKKEELLRLSRRLTAGKAGPMKVRLGCFTDPTHVPLRLGYGQGDYTAALGYAVLCGVQGQQPDFEDPSVMLGQRHFLAATSVSEAEPDDRRRMRFSLGRQFERMLQEVAEKTRRSV